MHPERLSYIKQYIRNVPDFPKKGIQFKDITPLLSDHEICKHTLEALLEHLADVKADKVVGLESRGFLFGMPLAQRLECGFIPIRKKGKLPYTTIEVSYALEYGTNTFQVHEDAIKKGDKVVIHDDLLATGGSALAAKELVEQLGGIVVAYSFIIELSFLEASLRMNDVPIYSLVKY
jgi:adenine phosphoribosyltransferase